MSVGDNGFWSDREHLNVFTRIKQFKFQMFSYLWRPSHTACEACAARAVTRAVQMTYRFRMRQRKPVCPVPYSSIHVHAYIYVYANGVLWSYGSLAAKMTNIDFIKSWLIHTFKNTIFKKNVWTKSRLKNIEFFLFCYIIMALSHLDLISVFENLMQVALRVPCVVAWK